MSLPTPPGIGSTRREYRAVASYTREACMGRKKNRNGMTTAADTLGRVLAPVDGSRTALAALLATRGAAALLSPTAEPACEALASTPISESAALAKGPAPWSLLRLLE
jgi:hypothetical protein